MLYTYTVMLVIGIASIISRLYINMAKEIFFGISAPVFVGFATVYFMIKYSNYSATNLNKMLMSGFAIKFIFYGLYIIIIFTVYPFKPIPFICSFTTSFIGLHLMEAVVLKKLQISKMVIVYC